MYEEEIISAHKHVNFIETKIFTMATNMSSNYGGVFPTNHILRAMQVKSVWLVLLIVPAKRLINAYSMKVYMFLVINKTRLKLKSQNLR